MSDFVYRNFRTFSKRMENERFWFSDKNMGVITRRAGQGIQLPERLDKAFRISISVIVVIDAIEAREYFFGPIKIGVGV